MILPRNVAGESYGTESACPDFKSNSEKHAVVRAVMAVMGHVCRHSRRPTPAAFGSSQDFRLLPYSRLTGTPGVPGGKNYKVIEINERLE
jgi:hypothetical protein